MLVALGKRWRMKPEELITELIEENYKSKSKRLKHLPPAGAFNICVDDRLDAKSSFFCVHNMAPKYLGAYISHLITSSNLNNAINSI